MITLLVVTSDIPFGDLIRQSLEETGRFSVRIAGEKESAVACIKEVDCPLVFLDTCLPEKDLLQIGAQVRQANSNTRFVVISEAGWHSALEELSPEDYLSKPFYLPDLLEMMNNFFPAPAAPETSPVSGKQAAILPGFQMSPAQPSISPALRWGLPPRRPSSRAMTNCGLMPGNCRNLPRVN
jgi:DNA-binding NtrC family response regulator